MEKTDAQPKAVFRILSFISIIILFIIYIGWLWLTPPLHSLISYSRRNYFNGLILALIYSVFIVSVGKIKSSSCFGKIFLVLTIFFGFLNFLYIANYFPSIRDIAKYNGKIYVLTHNRDFLESPNWDQYQVTKWKLGIFPETFILDRKSGKWKFVYDEKTQLVSIATMITADYERLLYMDSEPPVNFDYSSATVFEEKMYYLTYVCDQNCVYVCAQYCPTEETHKVYQCELDNTSCTPLPFQYTGDVFEISSIERDRATDNIDVYFYLVSSSEAVLIYSDGTNPRCHIDGCEILVSP
jgi:hypothetical protein